MNPKEKPAYCLDASALVYSGCARKLRWTVVDGWKSKIPEVSMVFGNAFHRFRRIFREKGMPALAEGVREAQEYLDKKKCYVPPTKKHLNANNLAFICTQYAMRYQNDDIEPVTINGEYLLEKTFALPYYSCDEFDVLLTGTMDEIGRHKRSGLYIIIDAKTTGSNRVDSHLASFKLSFQLRFYRYILRLYAQEHKEFKEMEDSGVASMIDGVYLKNTSEKNDMFNRGEMHFYSDEEIEETKYLLDSVFQQKFLPWVEHENLPPREGMITGTCHAFTNCTFFPVCAQPDNKCTEAALGQFFEQKHYNPLEFQE